MIIANDQIDGNRLCVAGPRLRRQLDRLYGRVCDIEALWTDVKTILAVRADERSDDLRALDLAREASPDWFVTPWMTGYSTYVDAFADTVAGIEAKVDYLAGLRVRYLHLLALLKARDGDSDGGFAVADYLAVEPKLGTMADVERLAARLRGAGISLCVDLALNHTADDHVWARAARDGDPAYRDFYIVVDAAAVRDWEAKLGEIFPTTAPGNFTFVPEMGGHVWTTFYPFQWDLNWANPRVFLAIMDVMLRLANHGFEAFRLDSIAFLWKEAGTDCRNRPHAHHIVRALRAALDIVAPATLLKAEAIVPTAYVAPYFGADEGDGNEPECHLVYNNSLMVAGWVGLAEGSAELPATILDQSGSLPPHANWLTYARCHDDIGWGAILGDLRALDPEPESRLKRAAARLEGHGGGWGRGEPFQPEGGGLHGTNGTLASLAGLEAAAFSDERECAFRRIALLNALAIAAGGLATTYMGDEIGLLNDPSYRLDPDRAHEGRWLHRPQMAWERTDKAAARRIRHDLAGLRAARVASGGAGAPGRIETGHAQVLGVHCGHDRVFLNFSDTPITLIDVAPEDWSDRLTGARAARALRLDGLAIAWLGEVE